MNDFSGLLAQEFGFKPQSKPPPMASSKASVGTLNFGNGSHGTTQSSLNSNFDHDDLFGSAGNRKNQDFGGLDGFSDVFGGPPRYASASESRGGRSSVNYDSMFNGSSDSGAKSSSLPVFDKPVCDDDIFEGVPGLKSSSSVKYDTVFSSMASNPKQSAAFADLLGGLFKKEPELKGSGRKGSGVEKGVPGFEDLIPGFGRTRPPSERQASKLTANATKTTSTGMENPFVALGSTSPSVVSSSGQSTDPLEQISKHSNSGSTKVNGSSVSGVVFDDIDPLAGLGKSVPIFSSEMNKRGKDGSPLRTGPSLSRTQISFNKEPTNASSVGSPESLSQKMHADDYRESHQTLFDKPTVSIDSAKSVGQTTSPPSYVNVSPKETNSQVGTSPRSEENLESSGDVWLTVSDIPLLTQPTRAPPPSRPPPPRPTPVSKAETGSRASTNARKKVNEFSSFRNSTQYFQSRKSVNSAARSSALSEIDELEDFSMGRTQTYVDEHADFLSSEGAEKNSAAAASAAAMKDAMDRAEAKFKHAKELRERENAKAARSKEAVQLERDEKAMQDAQERELRENHERLEQERRQREREEEEGERRRLQKERERAREIEKEREEKEEQKRRLEREREKARQAVERATREVRERAAADARQKAERAAVGKANAEARERAERAAVQRAQAEARERAAAEAKERAEKAAAEARERANAEASEKEARERAAFVRAEAEAQRRVERAAVERVAAEARERAAAAAKVNQQKNENDLESFFSMGGRPSSTPRPRPNSSDPLFDNQHQNRQGPTSVGASSSMKKASSTVNIVDDLTSIFGAAPSSGEFQEVEGESEERCRARLERYQRTQERAANAVAEKNQRDLQAQKEQEERHRIADALDAEIKRWAAGKEGNLRALLSSLQYVLWPGCGWQPVSLTDLITGASVKKVYRKSTLYVHPDKLQQKGANLQQKYIAEKIFDLLQDAWNKFNSEELY